MVNDPAMIRWLTKAGRCRCLATPRLASWGACPKMGILYPMQDMDDYFIAFLYWNLWWLGATTILGNLDMNEYVGI